jgi:hypothetical protein
MTLTAVLEVATIAGFLVVMAGGKQRRERGWRMLCGLLLAVGFVEGAAMAIAVGPHEEHFDVE